MGIPSIGTRDDLQCYALRRIEKQYKGKVELVYPEVKTQRIFHDFARNGIVEDFLASDCDILWFLDADVSPPPDILDLVVKPQMKWEAAGATYPVFMCGRAGDDAKVVFTNYTWRDGKLTCGNTPTKGIAFVDGLATGCLFLRKSVFTKLKKPYFEFKYNPETREMIGGEDLEFAKKLSDIGIKFYTDFSLVCRHQKSVDLFEVNNYAISYANNAVDAYHRAIRPQIEALANEVTRLKSKTGSGILPVKNELVLPNYFKK